jgi:hypothetical protein
MPEATPQDVDENLSAWYKLLQADTGPVDTAEAYVTLCSELRSKGNPSGTGPQFLVCNTGGNQLQIISCLFERPASIPDMPPDSPFAQRPYIAVLNNKETPEDEWEYGPITAEALFGKCTARLVKWADIKEPTARANRKGYTQPRRDHALEFYPVLPIYGSQICEKMVQLLYGPYGPDEVQPSLKAICYTLKNYVDAIPTKATRNLARRSVASFVTNCCQ